MRSHVFARERLDDVWLSKTFQLNPPIMSQVVQDGVNQLGIVGERSAYKNDVGVRIFENRIVYGEHFNLPGLLLSMGLDYIASRRDATHVFK